MDVPVEAGRAERLQALETKEQEEKDEIKKRVLEVGTGALGTKSWFMVYMIIWWP